MGSSFVICSEQMQNARKKIEALCLLGRINYGLLQQNVDIMSPLSGCIRLGVLASKIVSEGWIQNLAALKT